MEQRIGEKEFIRAYDSFGGAIFRHCYFRLLNREEAKDILQETFIRTWEYIVGGGNIDNIRAFLYRVANNLIVDHSRKKHPYSLEELQSKGFEPSYEGKKEIEKVPEVARVLKLLSKLSPQSREIFVMRYIDGLGPKEISRIQGETENNISVKLHRATKKLRNLLERYE